MCFQHRATTEQALWQPGLMARGKLIKELRPLKCMSPVQLQDIYLCNLMFFYLDAGEGRRLGERELQEEHEIAISDLLWVSLHPGS